MMRGVGVDAGTTVYWLLFGWEWGTGVRYRRVPGASKQFRLLLRRAGVKWVRGWGLKFVDLLLFIGSAIVIGNRPPSRLFFSSYLPSSPPTHPRPRLLSPSSSSSGAPLLLVTPPSLLLSSCLRALVLASVWPCLLAFCVCMFRVRVCM